MAEQIQVQNSYRTSKPKKNKSSNFGLIDEIMAISRILLSVMKEIMRQSH